MSRKKEKIRIIKKYSNKENYTFVDSDNILNTTKNNESINGENKLGTKPDERFEKKIHSSKSQYKGRKILGKSLQGHSLIYE